MHTKGLLLFSFKNTYMWCAFEGTVGFGYGCVMDQSCILYEEFGKNLSCYILSF